MESKKGGKVEKQAQRCRLKTLLANKKKEQKVLKISKNQVKITTGNQGRGEGRIFLYQDEHENVRVTF